MLERTGAASLGSAEEKGRWLYSVPGVIAVVAAYSVLHVTARLMASANLGEDDPREAVLIQTLEPGYLQRQPPLYDWALWLLEQITGPGALPFQILKYSLLTATCAFIFASARRATRGDAFWAFLSVESLALIYQISWRFHEGFTHAVGAMCAVAATLWAMLRLMEGRHGGDYALFGLIAGLGLLTVTTFWVFLAALIIAASLQPAGRRAVMAPAFGLSLAVALAIAAPWFVWLSGTPGGLGAILPSLAIGQPGYTRDALTGLGRALTQPVLYLAPLIFLYPLFFPAFTRTAWQAARGMRDVPRHADPERLILHLTLLNMAALVLGAVLFGIDDYPTHALMPLFLVTSIWLTAQARKAARGGAEIRRFVRVAIGIAVFAFVARAANMYVQEPVCKLCRWGTPYEALAGAIKARGFTAGTLLVHDDELAGNLRRFFPDARVVIAGSRYYAPPRRPEEDAASAGPTVLVWEAGKREAAARRGFADLLPDLPEGAPVNATPLDMPWRGHMWKPDGYRVSRWRMLLLDRPF